MTAYPVMLDGSKIRALVVGGGAVATRKVRALRDAGAHVHVVAPRLSSELEALANGGECVRISRDMYQSEHLADATLAFAATDDPKVNADVARDASARGILVNVADAPELGEFTTPAVLRRGDIVVAVGTGGVPSAAARIRDFIARRIDGRYAAAVGELSALRRRLLSRDERGEWAHAARALIGDDFCDQVESGGFQSRIDEWR